MRVVVQRAKNAAVTVQKEQTGQADKGYVLLVGFTHDDTLETIQWMAKKVLNLRVFSDEEGKMNRSIQDIGGSILSVSQFTLYGNAKKGNRPSFVEAMDPVKANTLFEEFNDLLRLSVPVETGVFGEEMEVRFTNDGPVTIILEK